MPQDISGLELARTFYRDAVEPILDRPHAAGLLGEGSEILGYDDARSRDHEWGPRLQVFVDAADVDRTRETIAARLPEEHGGYPTTWFSLFEGRSTHHIEVASAQQRLAARLPSIPWPAELAAEYWRQLGEGSLGE